MTKGAALARACGIWGKAGAVRTGNCYRFISSKNVQTGCSAFGAHLQPCPCGVKVYSVGHLAMGGLFFMVESEGATWEDAFARYEEKRKREREEFERARAEIGKAARERRAR